HFGAEERLWDGHQRLHEAAVQSGDRRTQGAVYLDLQQVVAFDPAGPGRGDLRQGPAFEFEHRESVVLDIDVVGLAALVDAARLRRHVPAGDRGNGPEQAGEDVAPM